MAGISRASLPEEFFDITSDMLLVQPEPQYVLSGMLTAATGAALREPSSLGLSLPNREFGTNGASYSVFERDQLMLQEPIMSGVVKVVPELGKGPGHTVRVNRPFYSNTTYTQASRNIAAGTSISTVGINAGSEQTSITLARFGGPYDQANSRVAPIAVERFDASVSLHSMAQLVGTQLKRDYARFKDYILSALLDQASTTMWPKGISVDTGIATNSAALMDWNLISRCEAQLDNSNIPTFSDGKRVLLICPAAKQQLQDDPQFARYAEKHPMINPILNPGYWKTAGGFHIFQSTTLPTDTATVSGVTINHNFAFGPEVLGAGVGRLPECVYSTDDNFGETAKVMWLDYSGYQLLDSRFVLAVHTSGTPSSTT